MTRCASCFEREVLPTLDVSGADASLVHGLSSILRKLDIAPK